MFDVSSPASKSESVALATSIIDRS